MLDGSIIQEWLLGYLSLFIFPGLRLQFEMAYGHCCLYCLAVTRVEQIR